MRSHPELRHDSNVVAPSQVASPGLAPHPVFGCKPACIGVKLEATRKGLWCSPHSTWLQGPWHVQIIYVPPLKLLPALMHPVLQVRQVNTLQCTLCILPCYAQLIQASCECRAPQPSPSSLGQAWIASHACVLQQSSTQGVPLRACQCTIPQLGTHAQPEDGDGCSVQILI